MPSSFDSRVVENLHHWRESGRPREWVAAHRGQWTHNDWHALVAELQRSPYWPLRLADVGLILEEAKRPWLNVGRWRESGHPRRWVAAHRGDWDDASWNALLAELSRSEFWPLEPDALGLVLEDCKREWWNARWWDESGAAGAWVEAHGGNWTHDDWLTLIEELRHSDFWPIDLDEVGLVLEALRPQPRRAA